VQRNDIANVSVEDLLVSSVCRCTNLAGIDYPAQVFDVCKNDISRLPIVLVVLSRSDWGDMRGHTSVYDDVLFSGMLGHW
jgi:hypothetical protein